MSAFSLTRDEDRRLQELEKKINAAQISSSTAPLTQTNPKDISTLTEEERKDYEVLCRKYQEFTREGVRRLKHHEDTTSKRNSFSSVETEQSSYFDSIKKGLYFWGTLGIMAVPGYVTQFVPGRDTPLRSHWHFITDQIILGGVPIVTKIGESGNHLEKLRRSIEAREIDIITGEMVCDDGVDDMKPTIPHPRRKYELALVVSCLTQAEMDGFGINAVEFAKKWHWLEQFGSGIQYEHVSIPDATADVVFDAVKRAVDSIHAVVTPTLWEEEIINDVKKQYSKRLAMYQDDGNRVSIPEYVISIPNHSSTLPSEAIPANISPVELPKCRVVYIHCKAGVGRSWMVLMCYLTTYMGKTFEEAYQMVKAKRTHVNPGEDQMQFVRDFQSRFVTEQKRKDLLSD